jgi:hypothetical protein
MTFDRHDIPLKPDRRRQFSDWHHPRVFGLGHQIPAANGAGLGVAFLSESMHPGAGKLLNDEVISPRIVLKSKR